MAQNMSQLYSTVITLFLVLAVGFVARKCKIIDETASKRFSTLIVCIGQPFMIIGSQIHIEYSHENLKTGVMILALGAAAHIIIAAIAFVSMMKVKDLDERKIAEFSVIFANCGFMGFPVLSAMFGERGLFFGSFYVILYNLFTWSWGMVILGRKRPDIKINPYKMIVNYGTVPCIIGFLIFALRIPIPEPLARATDYIGSLCTPVSMLITGGLISTMSIKELFAQKILYFISALKLIVVPLIVCVIAAFVGLSDELVIFVTIMSGLPTAANAVMFSEMYDIKPPLAAGVVGMTTLLSTATLPIVIGVAQKIIEVI